MLDSVPPDTLVDSAVWVGLDIPDTTPPVIFKLLRLYNPESTAIADIADGSSVNVPLI